LEWTRFALPVLILLASCWQMLGTSFGANAMGSSIDTREYWQSREKWSMTQYFNRDGYTVTQTGWKNDVYQLATTSQKIYESNGNEECLYKKISDVHIQYLEERDTVVTEAGRIARYQQYNEEVSLIRKNHILKLRSILTHGENVEWVFYKQPVKSIKGWFDRERNINAKKMIIFVLNICF